MENINQIKQRKNNVPERWEKFKYAFPESHVYVLSIPPLPENGRYWREWVKSGSLPKPFSEHDNKEVQDFNRFCEKYSPVPYWNFYDAFVAGQVLEGFGSTLDSPDTVDPNHFTQAVYRSVLEEVIKEVDSGSAMAEDGIKGNKAGSTIAEAEISSRVESDSKGILGYCHSFLKKLFVF